MGQPPIRHARIARADTVFSSGWQAIAEDMTGTLKPFAKSELTAVCKEAISKAKKAKAGKAEL